MNGSLGGERKAARYFVVNIASEHKISDHTYEDQEASLEEEKVSQRVKVERVWVDAHLTHDIFDGWDNEQHCGDPCCNGTSYHWLEFRPIPISWNPLKKDGNLKATLVCRQVF